MLKRLRIDNFKSLINVIFEPGDVNLVVGKNNSGKTNLCQAIRFLRLSATHPLQDAVFIGTGELWNLPNAYLNKDTIAFECKCLLSIDNEDVIFDYTLRIKAASAPYINPIAREYSVDIEQLTISGGRFGNNTSLLLNERGKVTLLNERRFDRSDPNPYDEIDAPTNATMVSRLYDQHQNRSATTFKNYLAGWLYYDLEAVRMRSGEAKIQSLVLEPDGSNLAFALYLLKTIEDRRYRRYVDLIRVIEPKLEGINFTPPTQDALYMTLSDTQDKRFGMASISSGTLKYMALTYIITMAEILADANRMPAPLVMIEEPENGIYVGYLKELLALTDTPDKHGSQFIFTSHSPYFIDLFDRYLENVHVLKSDGRNSEIRRLDSQRMSAILDAEFSLGEAHFRELLG